MKSSERETRDDKSTKNNMKEMLPHFQWGVKRRMACQHNNSSSNDDNNKSSTAGPTTSPTPNKRKPILPLPVKGTQADTTIDTTKTRPGPTTRHKRNEKPAAPAPEFRLTLTKEEIDADFITMTGTKPPRKPTKRPRTLQTLVESAYPGLMLSKTITPDRYGI